MEIWTFIFWWLITFEPLEQKQSYISLLKVLMCGMNAWGAQWHGGIFILQFTTLKMVLLLHKTALVNFPMATTVSKYLLIHNSDLRARLETSRKFTLRKYLVPFAPFTSKIGTLICGFQVHGRILGSKKLEFGGITVFLLRFKI